MCLGSKVQGKLGNYSNICWVRDVTQLAECLPRVKAPPPARKKTGYGDNIPENGSPEEVGARRVSKSRPTRFRRGT